MEGTAERMAAYLQETYETPPERLWDRYPNYMVFRRPRSRKWYAIVMTVPRPRLGLEGEGDAVLLNVKCGPLMTGTLLSQPGFLPAYHMNKTAWVSVLLDGTVPDSEIFPLIELSWRAAAPKGGRPSKG